MTSKEKAEEIIKQAGGCYGFGCGEDSPNQCPCFVDAHCVGNAAARLAICREALHIPNIWDNAPEWAHTARIAYYGDGEKIGHSPDYTRKIRKPVETRVAEIAVYKDTPFSHEGTGDWKATLIKAIEWAIRDNKDELKKSL